MRCNGIARRLIASLLTVLLLVVMTGAIGFVSADPGNGGIPTPGDPPSPDGTSTSAGDALLLLDMVLGIGCAVLL
jgi:hypothetical protein